MRQKFSRFSSGWIICYLIQKTSTPTVFDFQGWTTSKSSWDCMKNPIQNLIDISIVLQIQLNPLIIWTKAGNPSFHVAGFTVMKLRWKTGCGFFYWSHRLDSFLHKRNTDCNDRPPFKLWESMRKTWETVRQNVMQILQQSAVTWSFGGKNEPET